MNWYVLYVITLKTDKLVKFLHKKNINAFVPMMEYYRRDKKSWDIKPMFNGYIFIKSNLDQLEFDRVIQDMEELRDGVIRQLKYKDTSALSDEEIDMFNKLLDEEYVLRLSYAYLEDNKAIVYKGPLKYYQDSIVKVDKHDRVAYLDISFMERYIKASLMITGKI
ncbi:MAG: hypothetical protein IKM20_08715 [Erysipelotrichales bacterium]|nr:hypothetical protein [Erysipelotrichales bacterium]